MRSVTASVIFTVIFAFIISPNSLTFAPPAPLKSVTSAVGGRVEARSPAPGRDTRALPALIPGLAQDGTGNVFISRIDLFLNTCPSSDPAITEIRNDIQVRRNGVLVGSIPCTEPVSQLPVSQYSNELIVLQGLRVIYYMDRGKTGHLPWTPGTLYNWMKTRARGINIKDGSGAFCCESYDSRTHIVIGTGDDFNRDSDKTWEGISGNIGLYAHETRHIDGLLHTSCCGMTNGCDQSFDLNNLPAYGVQWWLEKAWLLGEINVGFGCLVTARVNEIRDWHRVSGDILRNRFCENKPALLPAPSSPGGPCLTSCTAKATSVSAASFAGPDVAPDSIAAVFGCELSTTTIGASTATLPVELGGTRISVIDNLGRQFAAQMFFVSSHQVNFVVPGGLAIGPATLTFTSSTGIVSSSSIIVSQTQPGLFSANATGQGVAAAVGYRVQTNGSQGYFEIVSYNTSSQSFVAVPIDLGPAGDQVFLVLFGTGIRRRSSLSGVTATIGGTPVTVAYAGEQGAFTALDQINLLIPRSLAGRGLVTINVTVDGEPANSLTANIK